MDIDLLSKMVKELILDNERVALPGLGSFVAEIVPAAFSDKGYTINPPYRKLYFRSKPDEGSDLILFYAKNNSVSEEVAQKVIIDFIAELKAILFHRKTVIFPGLGRLRATKENNVFFVADEDLDIYPEGFGLEPISLKTHDASTAEVKAAVSDLKSILTDTEPQIAVVEEIPAVESLSEDPVAEAKAEDSECAPTALPSQTDNIPVEEMEVSAEVQVELVEEHVEPEAETVEQELPVAELLEDTLTEGQHEVPAGKSSWLLLLKVIMWLLIVVAALTIAYMVVARMYPQWIDQFLYTPEELDLLNNR